jgi:hypothetical protein
MICLCVGSWLRFSASSFFSLFLLFLHVHIFSSHLQSGLDRTVPRLHPSSCWVWAGDHVLWSDIKALVAECNRALGDSANLRRFTAEGGIMCLAAPGWSLMSPRTEDMRAPAVQRSFASPSMQTGRHITPSSIVGYDYSFSSPLTALTNI